MNRKMIFAALLISASLCGQSFASSFNQAGGCSTCAPCNKCCKPLFSGLANFMNCRFPPSPALVIKPITCHRCCK